MTRNYFNAIEMTSVNPTTRKQVNKLFADVQKSDKIDEHGNWEFGIEDWGKGFASLNYDFYGIGRDFHSKRLIAVVQLRQCTQRKKGYYKNVRKSYFLIGRNEDNTAFAHPVSANVIHSAIAAGKDVCRACQDWIFGIDYKRVLRQGDVCLIPLKSKATLSSADQVSTRQFTVDNEGSHLCNADDVRVSGNVYVLNPSLTHLPGTHPDFANLTGWYKVVLGRRGNFYDFAVPTVD